MSVYICVRALCQDVLLLLGLCTWVVTWCSRQFKLRARAGSAAQARCVMFRLAQYIISKVSTTLLPVNNNNCTTYTLTICIVCCKLNRYIAEIHERIILHCAAAVESMILIFGMLIIYECVAVLVKTACKYVKYKEIYNLFNLS